MAFRFAAQEALAAENRTITFHGLLRGLHDSGTGLRTWSIAAPVRPKFSLEAGATDTSVAIKIPVPEGEYLGCVTASDRTGTHFGIRTRVGNDDVFTFTIPDAGDDIEISFQISYNVYPDR